MTHSWSTLTSKLTTDFLPSLHPSCALRALVLRSHFPFTSTARISTFVPYLAIGSYDGSYGDAPTTEGWDLARHRDDAKNWKASEGVLVNPEGDRVERIQKAGAGNHKHRRRLTNGGKSVRTHGVSTVRILATEYGRLYE